MQDLHEFSYIYNSTRYLPTSHIRTQIASSLKRLLFNQKCENNETTSVWSLTSYHNQILVSKWRVRNFFICLKSAPYEIPVWGQIPVWGRYVVIGAPLIGWWYPKHELYNDRRKTITNNQDTFPEAALIKEKNILLLLALV